MMKSHLSSKQEYRWLFYGLIFFFKLKIHPDVVKFQMTKPFISTSLSEMESLLEEKITGLWLWSLFRQELNDSLVVTEWFHHMARSRHHHLKLRAKLMQTWARKHGRDKGKEQSVFLKRAFPMPSLRFTDNMRRTAVGKAAHFSRHGRWQSPADSAPPCLAFLCKSQARCYVAWLEQWPLSQCWMDD